MHYLMAVPLRGRMLAFVARTMLKKLFEVEWMLRLRVN